MESTWRAFDNASVLHANATPRRALWPDATLSFTGSITVALIEFDQSDLFFQKGYCAIVHYLHNSVISDGDT